LRAELRQPSYASRVSLRQHGVLFGRVAALQCAVLFGRVAALQCAVLFGRVAALQCAVLFAALKRTNLMFVISIRSRGLKTGLLKRILSFR